MDLHHSDLGFAGTVIPSSEEVFQELLRELQDQRFGAAPLLQNSLGIMEWHHFALINSQDSEAGFII